MGNNKILEITKLMNQAGINPDCLSFDECIKEISSHDCRMEKLGKGAVFAPFKFFLPNTPPAAWCAAC